MKPLLAIPVLFSSLCAGCGTHPPVDYARTYPKAIQTTGTLDIQVFRRDRSLDFTNTTAFSFGKSTIWLNRRFSRPIESIGVGETVSLPLEEFRDEFQEHFRPGGFFAAERPEVLFHAQIQTIDEKGAPAMLSMVVVQILPEE